MKSRGIKTNPQHPKQMSTTTLSKPGINAFADNGESIIDTINPDTGLSSVYGETLEQIRQRYPNAQFVNFDEWLAAKAARQDAEEAVWQESTEEHYWYGLECVPPAATGGGAFLVGEPMDHHCASGLPRFTCHRQTRDGKFVVLSKPITIPAFRQMLSQQFASAQV